MASANHILVTVMSDSAGCRGSKSVPELAEEVVAVSAVLLHTLPHVSMRPLPSTAAYSNESRVQKIDTDLDRCINSDFGDR